MSRPIKDQVVVITGASSGIGRITAFKFGEQGASVVLAARNDTALQAVAREIELIGGKAHAVITDVADPNQVQRLADEAVSRFGHIDTWINNASVALYATVEDANIEEMERVIRVNLLGMIYGCKAALPYMRQQGSGTIINVSSVLGQRSIQLQAAYSAAKHGVKGFSDALRLELQQARSGIRVTTVFPASINTPFFNHARSKLGVLPKPVPPVYEPEVVAEAIVYAAQHYKRDIYAGGASKFFTVMERMNPALVDRFMAVGRNMTKRQQTDRPDDGRDNLFTPWDDIGSIRGEFGQEAMQTSGYTRYFELYSKWKGALMIPAIIAGTSALIRSRTQKKPKRPTLKHVIGRAKTSLERIAG